VVQEERITSKADDDEDTNKKHLSWGYRTGTCLSFKAKILKNNRAELFVYRYTLDAPGIFFPIRCNSMYYPFAILIIFTRKKKRKTYCQRLKSWRRNNKLSYTKKWKCLDRET